MQTSIVCNMCQTGRLVTDLNSGEIVCASCGLVSPEILVDGRAEWRTFESDKDNRQRVGAPNSLASHDMGLSTVIGNENQDSSGHKLGASVTSSMQRLRLWDARSRASFSPKRNLTQAFRELGKLKNKLGLPEAVVEKAAYLYRKAEEKRLIRGRSVSSMLSASVYLACREIGSPKSIRELTEATGVRFKGLSQCYRLLVMELDIKVPLVDPMKYVAKIANKTGISEKTKRVAIKIMQEIVKIELSAGKNPIALAATVLYIACLVNNEIQTQKCIADAAGVTEVTIRSRYKELKTKFCASPIWNMV